MKSVEFAYWLQGFLELTNPKTISEEQTEMIKKHLALVFKHEIDPSYPDKEELDKIHNPAKPPKVGISRPTSHPAEHKPVYRC